jgi:carbamoyl-phosphate synthase large subunit
MKKKYKILITGACGVTSRSVVRSLLMSEKFKNAEFIGTDICENLFGLYEGLYKTIYKVPNVKSNEYKQLMEQIIIKESIDVAIIIPELEVLFWSINKFCIPYIVPPPKFAESVISKKNLYDMLKETCLIPDYRIFSKEEILSKSFINPITYPCWIRDFEEGSTSGKGSFMASNKEQMEAWMVINEGIDNFMVSEFLPGRNYACHLLYFHGKL